MELAKIRKELEELEDRDKKLYVTSIFVSKMVLTGFVFQLILRIYPDTYGLQSFLAQITQLVLNSVDLELERQGALLFDSQAAYLVTQDCLGWKSMAAFTALVFSSTSGYRKHLKPVLAGIVVISLVNIFRISTTVYLSHINLISFDIIHSFFWKWVLTFTVLALWALWLYKNSGKAKTKGIFK